MNTQDLPKIHVAIPLLNEFDNLPRLIKDIEQQSFKSFVVWFCVNQPESWHLDNKKFSEVLNNQQTLRYLERISSFHMVIIDKSSKGNGWVEKLHGVGIARKVLMDSINQVAEKEDIIISLDGDTHFDSDYFQSVFNQFHLNPTLPAIAIPYYHLLSGDGLADRAILRYEIYMRHYEWNLRKIGSPYAFTALGSAMACKVWAYRKIGGMTPKKSGEDFYFLQKMVKFKEISTTNTLPVYPAARFSDRVYFGTGPAMIKGAQGDWSSYPIYRSELFESIHKAYKLFPILFDADVVTPVDEVLEPSWATTLRNNCRSKEVFVKACHDKFDGLRTLQFLKLNQKKYRTTDEENLRDFAEINSLSMLLQIIPEEFSFENSDLERINQIRDYFFDESI
ncbi:MAG: hypothetical protein JXR34_06965 [Bacteroidales bacterium]|nr:hypothetical protein [Bacteroidales bacterium]